MYTNDKGLAEDGPTADIERYTISSDDKIIASFQRTNEETAPGKPWLDRTASVYEWVPMQGVSGPGEAQAGIHTV